MKKIVSIHQPTYFPWLGLIDKIAKSDIFIVLDNVQFNKEAFQHRTLYSNPSGKPSYLSLSVNIKNRLKSNFSIRDIKLKNQEEILVKHLRILQDRYRNTKNQSLLTEKISSILLDKKFSFLLDLSLKTIQLTLEELNIHPQILLASELDCHGSKTELLLSLTQSAGATAYLSGRGAESYMDDKLFTTNGIKVLYQDFIHPEYDQKLRKNSFQPGCLALELPLLQEEPIHFLQTHYQRQNQVATLRSLQFAM